MTTKAEGQIDELLASTAAEYADEERAAAEEESREASAVFSVRLPADTYNAVRAAADRAHLTPSALIRQWVAERIVETSSSGDRVADLARPPS